MRELVGSRGKLRLVLAGLVGSGLVLGGCAETQLIAHTAKQIGRDDAVAKTPGIYKVGTPYRVGQAWYYPKVDYAYRESGIASWYGPGFHGQPTANGETFDQNALTAAHRTLPMPSMARVTNLENGRSIKVRINDRGPFSNGRIIDLSQRAAELLGFRRKGTAKVLVEIVPDESRRMAAAALSGEAARTAPVPAPLQPVASETLASDVRSVPPVTEPDRPAASQTALASPAANGDARRDEPEAATLPEPDGQVSIVPVGASAIYVQAGSFARPDNAERLRARLAKLGPIQVEPAFVNDRQYFRVRFGPFDSVEEADRLLAVLLDTGHEDARVVVD